MIARSRHPAKAGKLQPDEMHASLPRFVKLSRSGTAKLNKRQVMTRCVNKKNRRCESFDSLHAALTPTREQEEARSLLLKMCRAD